MPRYYFHFRDATRLPDDPGLDFSDLLTARREAINSLLEIARHRLQDADRQQWTIDVYDHAGAALLEAALTIEVRHAAAK